MSDIRLFRLDQGKATAIDGAASHLEKPLQTLIETNLDPLLGIRFVASEYSTGKTHAGRIDTRGLDENHCPVILEYKRSSNENVINQGVVFQNKALRLFLNLDPDEYPLEEGFSRDVRDKGHWGTGDLELMIHSLADLEKAKPYLNAAYGGKNA